MVSLHLQRLWIEALRVIMEEKPSRHQRTLINAFEKIFDDEHAEAVGEHPRLEDAQYCRMASVCLGRAWIDSIREIEGSECESI